MWKDENRKPRPTRREVRRKEEDRTAWLILGGAIVAAVAIAAGATQLLDVETRTYPTVQSHE